MATVDDKKIIFSMVGLTKTIKQTNKTILKIFISAFSTEQRLVSLV